VIEDLLYKALYRSKQLQNTGYTIASYPGTWEGGGETHCLCMR